MPRAAILQSYVVTGVVLLACWCVGAGTCVVLAVRDPEPNLRHPAVLTSAGLTVGWMGLSWLLMIIRRQSLVVRLTWTLGALMLLLHLVLAFGLAHQWSHDAAVMHVREVGGFGGGIVVSYLFANVWLADVAWWWVNPASHASRPAWLGWMVHGFMALVVFNATVVFGGPERRVTYSVAGVVLAGVWILSKNRVEVDGLNRWPEGGRGGP